MEGSGQALPALLLGEGGEQGNAGVVKISWGSGRIKGHPEGAKQPAATIPADGFACGEKKKDTCTVKLETTALIAIHAAQRQAATGFFLLIHSDISVSTAHPPQDHTFPSDHVFSS